MGDPPFFVPETTTIRVVPRVTPAQIENIVDAWPDEQRHAFWTVVGSKLEDGADADSAILTSYEITNEMYGMNT